MRDGESGRWGEKGAEPRERPGAGRLTIADL